MDKAINGQTVKNDEPFTLFRADGGLYYPMYPRDADLPPGESINCGCIAEPIVSEYVLGLSLEERNALRDEAIAEMNEEYDKKVEIDNSQDNGNIKPREGDLGKYVGMPITNTDNQGIREWYVANVSNIPNLIDNSQPIEIQARKAYELRNQYKRDARSAMSDKETVRILEKRRPVPTFEQLLEHKIRD